MSAHTPGPWVCYADLPSTDPNWHIVTNASRMRVVANVYIEPCNERCKADARLIAAAPELLEALREILTDVVIAQGNMRNAAKRDPAWDGCADAIQPRVDAARAAIAKAEGRS